MRVGTSETDSQREKLHWVSIPRSPGATGALVSLLQERVAGKARQDSSPSEGEGRWLSKRLSCSLGHISKRSNMQLGWERAFWCCLTLSQKTQDNLRALKSSRLVADRVSELPLEFISLYPPPSPLFITIFSHMTCSKCNRLEFSLGDGLFRAILSTDCKILASEFPLLRRPLKQGERWNFPNFQAAFWSVI